MASTQPRARTHLALAAVLAVVAAVTAAGAAAPPVAAQTATAQTLHTGQVQTLAAPGVTEMTPGDGRLAGYGFETTITGVAFTDRAGTPGDAVVDAGPGDQLVVISATQTTPDQSRYYAYPTQSLPTYTLTDGSATIALGQIPQLVPTATQTWAAAIPAASPATFTVTFAGFTQSFDLRAGRRVGPSPTALYRDPTHPAVTVDLSATQTLTATGSPADPVTIQIAPQSAMLGYFQPATTLQPPPPPDRAWLIVDLHGPVDAVDASGSSVDCPGELAYPDIYLQTPAGRVRPGAALDSTPGSGQCLSDVYAFEVPATLTTATLAVRLDGTVAATDAGSPVTVTFAHQSADFSVNLPPLPAPLTQGYLTRSPPPTAGASPTAAGPTTGRHPASSPLPLVIGLIALLAVAAAGTWAAARRRRTLAPRPVTHTPRSLLRPPGDALPAPPMAQLAAATAELGAGPQPDRDAPDEQTEPAAAVTATAPATEPAVLVVCLLGPPAVEGLRKPIRRRGVTRLLYTLALHHAQPVTVEQLRDLTATTDARSEAAETVISYASILRSATPEGALPQIGAGQAGYRLDPELVDTDVAVFDTLARQAGDLATPEQLEAAMKALSLVRGVPLADSSWHGIEAALRDLTTRIERLAADTSQAALAARDARRAEQAVDAGLRAVPGSPVLWETRLVAAAGGSGYGLHRAWSDTQHAIGADAQMLAPTFQRLAQGQF